MKHFEEPQRSVTIKIQVLKQLPEMLGAGRVSKYKISEYKISVIKFC